MSPDRSPQTRKGHKTLDDDSIAVKFRGNISEIRPLMMLFNSEKNNNDAGSGSLLQLRRFLN